MGITTIDHWDKLIDRLNIRYIRSFIILSLILQTFLNFFAPLRKRTSTLKLIVPLWFAYLLADWAATYSIGLISQKMNFVDSTTGYDNLLAFWASFLLLHLGGPDKITAYTVEDNKLWHRHAFTLVAQSFFVIRVLYQSLPNRKLRIPTALVVISGFLKYYEKTKSLYLARLNRFRASILKDPNFSKKEDYYNKKAANLPVHIEREDVNKVIKDRLSDDEVVLYARHFYSTFKGLIVDLKFRLHQVDQSRDFFLRISAEDAFKVIAAELNLIYDDLFTKARVVHKLPGYLRRVFSFALIVTSLVLFYCDDKYQFKSVDVSISYTLLLGAVASDVIALISIITSDWLTLFIKKLTEVDLKPPTYTTVDEESSPKPACTFSGKLVHAWEKRWSEYVPTYSLIEYCVLRIHGKTEKLMNLLRLSKIVELLSKIVGLMNIIDAVKYVKHEKFSKELKNHIFKELHMKSGLADDLKTVALTAANGNWVLEDPDRSDLPRYVVGFDFDQTLLICHIATELLYYSEIDQENENNYRKFSKILSGYMLHLLVMQPEMISPVIGIGQMRFRHTCQQAQKYASEDVQKACKDILDQYPNIGDIKKSELLFRGSKLAKYWRHQQENKWEKISKVWVEMLSYAAIHSSAEVHAAELSKGGELITFVWFLMAHLGLGNVLPFSEEREGEDSSSVPVQSEHGSSSFNVPVFVV